ncbi:hypothetical protein BDL97_14G057500 [Sphagnum fallax]|nr:hypothetical protein BDL97_14G057500 [Sphagnum fallax]
METPSITVEPLRYERAIPGAFQSPAAVDASGASRFFMYTIEFSDFHAEGTDAALQHLASDFLLLAPQMLDGEISGMSVNLHLPNCASVQAHVTYCGGPVLFDSEKVQTMKLFTAWMFHFLTGKSVQQQSESSDNHGPKYYYILPLLCSSNGQQSPETISAKLIDWTVVRASLGSSLVYKRKSEYADLLAELEDAYAGGSEAVRVPVEEGKLRMRNGTFNVHEMEDAVVYCTNNGSSYFIHGSLQRFPDNTLVQQSSSRSPLTYTEYYAKKWKYKLLFPNQPLLKGYRLLQAANYLRKTSSSSFNGQGVVKGWENMELPAEVCTLHVGMYGKLFRGAMRLPSVLHSLEMTLVAADLRNTIGLPLSCYKMQEALTSGACESNISYETLELLGDSILNFAGGTYVFMEHPCFNREQLHLTRHKLVCNKALHQFALLRGLTPYVFAELWNPRLWVPPGPGMGNHGSQEGLEGQILGRKTLADVVEAIVGVYLMNGSLEASLKAMTWLGLPMYLPSKFPEAPVLERLSDMNLLGTADIASLQNKLGYQFNDTKLLVSAFDNGHDEDRTKQEEGCEFQRLSFLGNSILDFLISRHLVQLYPQLDPASLTHLKHATVNIENFASIALHHGLHVYLQKVSPKLTCQIRQFAILFWQEGGSAFGIGGQSSPRALGALIQTITGAIFLDSYLDIELVWKILEPLLQPLATPETVMLHPLRQLEILCQKQGRKLDVQSEQSNGVVQAHVFIDCILLGTSQNKERNVARRLAACKALHSLSHQACGFLHHDMKKADPNVCGKADSICSSTTVGKCNMGIATSYPYNLSGQGMWQRISTLGHLFFLILKLLFARPQMTARMHPSISVMPELELDSKGGVV